MFDAVQRSARDKTRDCTLEAPFSLRPLVVDHPDLQIDHPAPAPQHEETEQCSTEVTEENELEQRPLPATELPAPESTMEWKNLPSYPPSIEPTSKVRVLQVFLPQFHHLSIQQLQCNLDNKNRFFWLE
jgi:hypothetical protein